MVEERILKWERYGAGCAGIAKELYCSEQVVAQFFTTLPSRHLELKALLAENFHIIQSHSLSP